MSEWIVWYIECSSKLVHILRILGPIFKTFVKKVRENISILIPVDALASSYK